LHTSREPSHLQGLARKMAGKAKRRSGIVRNINFLPLLHRLYAVQEGVSAYSFFKPNGWCPFLAEFLNDSGSERLIVNDAYYRFRESISTNNSPEEGTRYLLAP